MRKDKYIVVTSTNLDVMIEYVNQKLAQGYELVGGLVIDQESYMQAMVRYGYK